MCPRFTLYDWHLQNVHLADWYFHRLVQEEGWENLPPSAKRKNLPLLNGQLLSVQPISTKLAWPEAFQGRTPPGGPKGATVQWARPLDWPYSSMQNLGLRTWNEESRSPLRTSTESSRMPCDHCPAFPSLACQGQLLPEPDSARQFPDFEVLRTLMVLAINDPIFFFFLRMLLVFGCDSYESILFVQEKAKNFCDFCRTLWLLLPTAQDSLLLDS